MVDDSTNSEVDDRQNYEGQPERPYRQASQLLCQEGHGLAWAKGKAAVPMGNRPFNTGLGAVIG